METLGNGDTYICEILKSFFLQIRHVIFEAYDEGADGSPYGASIPIEKGFNPFGDVLLAYEMNGETLPR